MPNEFEAKFPCDLSLQPFDLVRVELDDFSSRDVDQVIMMPPGSPLYAYAAASEAMPFDQADLGE